MHSISSNAFMSTLPHADGGPGSVFSMLEVMRVAQLASHALSRNLSMTLPPDYTPLTLAEVFYMVTMGGARGTMLITQANSDLWPGFSEGGYIAATTVGVDYGVDYGRGCPMLFIMCMSYLIQQHAHALVNTH